MLLKNRHSRSGFTLLEVVVGLAIGVVVALVILVIVIQGLQDIRGLKRQERLHVNASYIEDTLAYWIRRAKPDGSKVVTPCQLKITLPNDSSQVISLNPSPPCDFGSLEINGEKITSNDVTVHIDFTRLKNSTLILMILRSQSGPETLSIETVIADRN